MSDKVNHRNNTGFDFSIDNLLKFEPSKRKLPELEPEDEAVGRDHELNLSSEEEEMRTYSWLNCTRFKPPKLPRSKRRSFLLKRQGRGPRIPFSPHQLSLLESTFTKSQYLSSDAIMTLATALNLSENRVKIWFQNRRARFRRERQNEESKESSAQSTASAESIKSFMKLSPSHQFNIDQVVSPHWPFTLHLSPPNHSNYLNQNQFIFTHPSLPELDRGNGNIRPV